MIHLQFAKFEHKKTWERHESNTPYPSVGKIIRQDWVFSSRRRTICNSICMIIHHRLVLFPIYKSGSCVFGFFSLKILLYYSHISCIDNTKWQYHCYKMLNYPRCSRNRKFKDQIK